MQNVGQGLLAVSSHVNIYAAFLRQRKLLLDIATWENSTDSDSGRSALTLINGTGLVMHWLNTFGIDRTSLVGPQFRLQS